MWARQLQGDLRRKEHNTTALTQTLSEALKDLKRGTFELPVLSLQLPWHTNAPVGQLGWGMNLLLRRSALGHRGTSSSGLYKHV